MSTLPRCNAWILSLTMVACGSAPPPIVAPAAPFKPVACMPAPSAPVIVEPTFELARLLPTTPRPLASGDRISRLGNVEIPVMSGFLPVVERTATSAIGWRPTASDAAEVRAGIAGAFGAVVSAASELEAIDRRAPGSAADRAACSDDACKQCLADESVALATGRERAVGEILRASEELDRALRASSPDDVAAQLVWATSLEARASAVEAPIERATLLAEALFTFERASQRAYGATRAWLVYGAARVADALGEDARLPSRKPRGGALVSALVAEILTGSPPPWMRVEALYRATLPTTRVAPRPGTMRDTTMPEDVRPPGDTFDARTLREAATLSLGADDALSKAQAGLRVAWARAAVREGRDEEAIEALAPLWSRPDRAAFTADAEPVLVDALERLGSSRRASLCLVDIDTFARVALELGTRAAMHFDPELARTAWTALREEARDTLAYPGALRGLTLLARDDEDEARRLRAELVALGERDTGGEVASPWARAVRARAPFTDAKSLDEAVRDGTVAMRLSHSRESHARARVLALASDCHAGAARGPALELEVDALGATRVTNDAEWAWDAPADAWRSVRACLEERGPDFFRTLGRPIQVTLYPKFRKPSRPR